MYLLEIFGLFLLSYLAHCGGVFFLEGRFNLGKSRVDRLAFLLHVCCWLYAQTSSLQTGADEICKMERKGGLVIWRKRHLGRLCFFNTMIR